MRLNTELKHQQNTISVSTRNESLRSLGEKPPTVLVFIQVHETHDRFGDKQSAKTSVPSVTFSPFKFNIKTAGGNTTRIASAARFNQKKQSNNRRNWGFLLSADTEESSLFPSAHIIQLVQ